MIKKNLSTGSALEQTIGFSRAVRIGNHIVVSGTAPLNQDGTTACPGDLYGQAKMCFTIMKMAIETMGGTMDEVIRTRIYLKNIKDWKKAAKAHGELFSEIQPACTFVEVNGFIDSEWLIETEADCMLAQKSPHFR